MTSAAARKPWVIFLHEIVRPSPLAVADSFGFRRGTGVQVGGEFFTVAHARRVGNVVSVRAKPTRAVYRFGLTATPHLEKARRFATRAEARAWLAKKVPRAHRLRTHYRPVIGRL